jgi:hypothetical protein
MARKYAEIVGVEQLEDVLNKLPAKVNRSVLLSATRESGKTLLDRAKNGLRSANNAQGSKNVDTDELVKMWPLKKSKTWRAGQTVGFKPMYDKRVESEIFRKYAPDRSRQMWAIRGPLWMEYGTSGRTRKGKAARRINPHGWFRRAVDVSIREIERDFKKILHKKINQLLNRYIKKHGW